MRGSLESQFSFVIEGRKALSTTTFRFKSVEEIANKFAFSCNYFESPGNTDLTFYVEMSMK